MKTVKRFALTVVLMTVGCILISIPTSLSSLDVVMISSGIWMLIMAYGVNEDDES